jgi:tetratricopeptide (TPR) repeat protein
MVNYYEMLGLNQGASEEEIRAKLKERKRIWTQRQNAPRPEQQQEASNNLRMVPDIEATLLDSHKRAAYDQQLRTAPREPAQVDTSAIAADELIQEGWRLLSVGNVPDALMVATKATEVEGNSPDAWALLGYCKAQWGEVEDAIYEYKRAIKLRPNDASFYFDLGGIHEGREQWQDAMQQYQRAAQIDPTRAVYRAAMGSVFIKNEMYKDGIEVLERCVAEEPANEGYKYLLAVAYTESTYQNWTYIEKTGQYLTTSPEHIGEAERFLEKARALQVSDSEVNTRIRDVQSAVDDARKKRFHGNPLAVGGAVILGLFMLFSGDKGVIPGGLYFLVFGVLYAVSCMTPQYRLNKRVIESGGETSTGWMMSGFSEGVGAGCFTVILSFALIMAVLPVMTLWNFVKNYARK